MQQASHGIHQHANRAVSSGVWLAAWCRPCRACATSALAASGTALEQEMPAHVLKKRQKKPQGYWHKKENRRDFLLALGEELGVSGAEGWQGVRKKTVLEKGGRGVLAYYSNSMQKALLDCLREAPKASVRPRHYWQERERQKEFMEYLAEQMNIQEVEDWRGVSEEDVVRHGGGGLLHLHNGSLHALLRETLLPSVAVYECRRVVPRSFWHEKDAVSAYLSYLQRRLGLLRDEDWHRVSRADVIANAGSGLLSRMGLVEALEWTRPGKSWRRKAGAKKATQRRLLALCYHIFATPSLPTQSIHQ